MAKITELVKTYRLLSDPNAPDWNVKFVGGIAIAFVIVAASAAALWNANRDNAALDPAAASSDVGAGAPSPPRACTAEEMAAEAARTGAAAPAGTKLPSGCVAPT